MFKIDWTRSTLLCFCCFKFYSIALINAHFEIFVYWPCWKKQQNPAQNTIEKCNGLNGYNGNCIGFNGNYNGVYWYVMDSIGAMLNPIGKMPKTHYKKEFCNGFTGKD